MRILAVLALISGLWTLPANAQGNPVVVELFTSQGCSSCPPADAYLHELAKRDDVVALALHVDYWDYIGWKDSFAHPAHAQRQRAYAAEGGRRMIYTPQMVINGQEHVVGNSPRDVARLIDAYQKQAPKVALEARNADGILSIKADPMSQPMPPMVVMVVRYIPESTVAIERGENAGHTLSYANVVSEMKQVGSWDGKGTLDLSVPMDGDSPVVVLLQGNDGSGQITAAAHLK